MSHKQRGRSLPGGDVVGGVLVERSERREIGAEVAEAHQLVRRAESLELGPGECYGACFGRAGAVFAGEHDPLGPVSFANRLEQRVRRHGLLVADLEVVEALHRVAEEGEADSLVEGVGKQCQDEPRADADNILHLVDDDVTDVGEHDLVRALEHAHSPEDGVVETGEAWLHFSQFQADSRREGVDRRAVDTPALIHDVPRARSHDGDGHVGEGDDEDLLGVNVVLEEEPAALADDLRLACTGSRDHDLAGVGGRRSSTLLVMHRGIGGPPVISRILGPRCARSVGTRASHRSW